MKIQISYICNEKLENKDLKDKKYLEVRDLCHYTRESRGAVHSICNLKYWIKNLTIMDRTMNIILSHFIIEELVVEFKKQFTCLGENTKKIHNLYRSNGKRNYRN